jgi:hypothetical protein
VVNKVSALRLPNLVHKGLPYTLVNGQKERLSVADAAKLLNITPEAIRQRIRRGTIEYEQDENAKYYVYLQSTEGVENNVHNNTNADYSALRDHIVTLKSELEQRNEELRRKDHLLAAALERIPASGSPPARAPRAPRGQPGGSGSPSPSSASTGSRTPGASLCSGASPARAPAVYDP